MPRPTPSAADLKLLDPDGAFRTRLEDDRQAIAQLSDTGDLDQLKQIVHRLAGAAGTFGYTDVGDIAIALDDAFVAGNAVAPADIARLLAVLEQALSKPEKSA
jgi:HPt (histidine-containing phosphotransfer) domain-containing protein